MVGIFSAPSIPAPAPAPPPPTREDPAIEDARRKAVIAGKKAKGGAATLLTGGAGVEGEAPVQRKTLLGQ